MESSGRSTRTDPAHLGEVLSRLFALRGYGQSRARQQLADVWREVAGEPIASHTKVFGVRDGVLQVGVSSSALLQELESFHKCSLLERLGAEHAELSIRDVKFRLRRHVA